LRLFYDALKSIDNKVYVCPSKLNEAKHFLNCDILNIKENDAYSEYERIKDELLQSDYNVFIYSGGLMSKVLIADLMKEKPNTTHIDIGSGLDNLFIGITRKYQIDKTKAMSLYNL
jgi:hypothetical protein